MLGLEVLYHPHFEPDLATLRSMLLITEKIYSIVPEGSSFSPSIPTRRHMDALPGTFAPTHPEKDDVEITKDYSVLDALNRSFAQISEHKQTKSMKGRFILSPESVEDTLEIGGAVLLHNFKIAYSVYHMLKGHELIYGDRGDGYFLVDDRAAALIVSFIAQRMSHRLGIKTLTGLDASFLLSTACDVYDGVIPDRNAVFASAVLKLHIPEDISTLKNSEYAELRKRYHDLRQSVGNYQVDVARGIM